MNVDPDSYKKAINLTGKILIDLLTNDKLKFDPNIVDQIIDANGEVLHERTNDAQTCGNPGKEPGKVAGDLRESGVSTTGTD